MDLRSGLDEILQVGPENVSVVCTLHAFFARGNVACTRLRIRTTYLVKKLRR